MATKPTTRIPDWASGGTRTDPGAGKEASGWNASERPPAQWWNWLLGAIGDWLTYLDDSVNGGGYRISLALDSTKSWDVSAQTTTVRSASFAGSLSNGSGKMYVCSLTNVYEYYVGEAYAPTNAVYNGTFDLTTDSSDSLHECIHVNDAGTRMYTLGGTLDNIYQWTLATPYTVSTASYDGALSISSQDSSPLKFDVSADGTKIYVFGQTNDSVYRYSMTAWDITSASYDTGQVKDVSGYDAACKGVSISGDGTLLTMAGDTATESVYQYVLSTPYDLTTAGTTTHRFDMTGFTTTPSDLSFSPSGRRMYIVEDANDVVQMFYTGYLVAPEEETP